VISRMERKEKMETKPIKFSTCIRCGVHRKDKSRNFFGVWFVDWENKVGWCPICAGVITQINAGYDQGRLCFPIPLQAIWTTNR
jgi:hypothetical protein